MSQIGSVYQNKLKMHSSNISPLKQKNEMSHNTNHSIYSLEYQETLNEEMKLPNKDLVERREGKILEQQQQQRQTTMNHLKLYKKLSNCCNLLGLKHAAKSSTNTPTPKSLCIFKRLRHSHFNKPIGCCSLIKCIQLYTCRNCNFKHSLLFVTFFSILLNLPLFFVQKVVSKIVPVKNSTIKQVDDNKTSEWLHTTSNQANSLTSADNQYNQGQIQVFTGLTEFGNSDFYKIFSWTRIMLIQVLPLLFLCLVNFCLLRFLHIANKRRQKYLLPNVSNKKPGRFKLHKANLRTTKVNKASSARWQAAQRKLTILLIVIICLFIAGQIPQAFAYITIFEAFNRHFGNKCKRWRCCPPYLIYRSIAHMLGLFTYSINFFVYLTLNKHFKQQLNIWFLSICPISRLQKRYLLKQNNLINHSYEQSKSQISLTNQHKAKSLLPHSRKCSSVLFCKPTKQLKRIDNTDLFSEAVSAPVDLCTNSKWENKLDCQQINEMKQDVLLPPTDHSFQCINQVKSNVKFDNKMNYTKLNYSSVPSMNDAVNYLIISNPFNINNNLLHKSTETQTHHQKLSLTLKNTDQSFISLQPTNCHTEIKYDLNYPSCIYKTFRAYYSHDSVIKNWIFQLTNLNNNNNNHNNNNNPSSTSTLSSTTSQSNSIYSNHLVTIGHSFDSLQHGLCYYDQQNSNRRKEDTNDNVKQNIIHCVNLNMLQNNDNKDYFDPSNNNNCSNNNNGSKNSSNSTTIENSKTCTHSIIDSDSHGAGLTFSHVYCPLIYRESDFDVISIDGTIEQDEPEPNSFL
ncbi:unnamed protein product [Schistosoma turkestanicum]|nr:unnamed protein product [Schistosoma turkestanicum]